MPPLLETICYAAPEGIDCFDDYVTFTRNYSFSRLDGCDRPFAASAAFWQLGKQTLAVQRVDGTLAERGIAERRAAPSEHLTAMAVFDGEIAYEPLERDGSAESKAGPGDLVLLDYRRCFRLRSPWQHSAALSLPRTAVEGATGFLTMAGLLPRTAEARTLHDFLRTLVDQLPATAAASGPVLGGVLRHLLVAAVRRGTPTIGSPVDADTRADAAAWLDAQPPGRATISAMTAALGLSRASLYRLFRADGGVMAFDRQRRLRGLHRALSEAPRAMTLAELGARWGFLDAAGLTRAFRTQFGYPMSAVRDHLPLIDCNPDAAAPTERFRRAISRMS